MKTFTFTDSSTGFVANVIVTENDNGTLSFVVEVDESTGTTGDMRAIYFNNTDNTYLSGLSIDVDESDGDAATTSDATDVELAQAIDKTRWVGSKDTNVNGEVIKENDGAFDTGIEFGSQGMAKDDVQRMEFTLSADQDLTIDSFDWSTIGLRATSVGDVDGGRNGSLKLTGEETTPPDDPNSVVAEDDFAQVPGELLETEAALQTGLMLGNALDNDFDPEGDSFQIISVTGADGTDSTADVDGWFGWVAGSQGGEIRLHQDGSYQFRDPGGIDFDGGYQIFEPLETMISYEVQDIHGAVDDATINVTLFPNESGDSD